MLAGCSEGVVPAGVMRVGMATQPRSLNPIFNDMITGVEEINRFYDDPLWGRDANGRLFPMLSDRVPTQANGGISRDGRTITVHIRHGVKWHDGVPFTSADVRFSWEAVMNPKNNIGSLDGFDRVQRIETPDPYTAIVRLKAPYARAVPNSFPQMIPAHALRGMDLNTAPFNAVPIGTGPFKVAGWRRGEFIDLVANDDYYLGRPKMREIRLLYVPSGSTAAIMLKTGELDLTGLTMESYRELQGSPNVKFVVARDRSTGQFFLNVSRPNLRDVRVRRALAYALDRRALIGTISFADDTGELANGYSDPGSFAYDPGLAQIPYDPKQAAQLFDEAGWRIGAGGVRFKDGKPLSLQIVARAGSAGQRGIDTRAQAMLRAAGVDATIKTYSNELMFAQASSNGVLATGNFDLFFDEYGNTFDPDSSWILTCARAEPNGYNESRYCNPALDKLEAAALATFSEAERRRYYLQIDRIVQQDAPVIFVVWPKVVYGMNANLEGFVYNGNSATWNSYQWSLQR